MASHSPMYTLMHTPMGGYCHAGCCLAPLKATVIECLAQDSSARGQFKQRFDSTTLETTIRTLLYYLSHGYDTFGLCGFAGIFEESNCNPNNLNHAVVLVGYGSEGGQDYWIIKNRSEKKAHEKLIQIHNTSFTYVFSLLFPFSLLSWGSSWGEGGFMRMARDGSNMCGIASYALFPII